LGIFTVVPEAFVFVAVAVMVRVLSVTQGDAHGGAEEKRQYVEKHP
jgi:hypothetical protein